MTVQVVRYPARDGEGRLLTWMGVRRYSCPQGCSTSFYDFKKASLIGPDGPISGRARSIQAAAWLGVSLFVAVGLVLLFALFLYGASAVPVPGMWARVLLWALVIVGFAAIAYLLRPGRRAAESPAVAVTTPTRFEVRLNGSSRPVPAAPARPPASRAPTRTRSA